MATAVEDGPVNDPPAAPVAGACYLLDAAPTGEWNGFANHIAAYSSAGWRFVPPTAGVSAFVKAKSIEATFVDGAWELGSVRASKVIIGGDQVVGPRAASIADPSGGESPDPESRSAIAAILATLRQHGLISS